MNKKVLAILLVTMLLVGACALALAACAETSTTVTYYVDGSVYRTITVTGTGASDPGFVPVKEGYTFAGWYLDRNFTSPFNFRDYASNENRSSISVYAYFVPVQTGDDDNDGDNSGDGGEEVITYRTVTFNVNGGDSEIQPREYQVGALMSLPVPEREGYTFIGWRDMFGDYYNAESVMPDEDITLTAVWEKKVTTFEDDYVMFAPATEGKKHDNDYYEAYRETVQTYLYVELTSDDLGGIDRVGKRNNFDLTQNVQMEFSVSSGYTLSWYEGNWNNPNGAQLFTLGYGSNIQLLTVSKGQRVVKRYLVDIYVLHDYYVSLYEDIFDTEPYDTVRVIENQRFSADTEIKQHGGFEYDCRVYWNSLLEEYVPYTYTDRVTRDISLYQTYKEKTISVIDEEGAALESVSVKPYTQYSLITAPQKQGYDFLGFRVEGEEDDNDWYFADITGNTTLNYLSLEEDIDLLTAVFAPKKYYQYVSEDGSKLHVVPTVPVVLYTNGAQRSISEIIYVAEGSTVPLPSQAPFDPMDERESFFVGWGYYKRTSGGKWLGDDFLFYKTVEKPAAVYAITDVVTGGSADYPWYGISLDSERTFSSGERIDASYRVHLPLEATYTLTVTTTGRVAFTVPAYQDQTSHNYTATSSSPATVPIYWDWGDSTGYGGGTIHFKVTSYSGSFTVKLTGPNAVNNEEYVTLDGENTIVYGQSATLIDQQNKVGYDHIFTDENNNKVTQNIEKWTYENGQTFNLTDEYIALDRTITFDSCGGSQVDAITQATDTTIQLPTPEREGYVFLGWFYEKVPAALSERVDIEVMPGVDTALYAAWADEEDAQYITYTATEEAIIITGYTGDNTAIKLPSEMFGLPVTGIGDRVFYNFTGLTSITIPDSITGIGNSAFYGCNNLKSITIPDSVTSMESYAFRGCNALTIYCEAASKPGGWSSSWNYSNCPVVWNCNNNESDNDGNIYYIAENGIRYALNNGTATVIRQSTTLSGEIIIPGEITYKDVAYSVTTVNASAFSGCSGLTGITIPDSVTSIGSGAFSGCSGLESITIPFVGASIKTASDTYQYPFGYIFGTSSYAGGVSTRQYYYGSSTTSTTSSYYYIPSSLKSVTVTGGNILFGAFYNCSGLTSITIGGSVISIGSSAFSGCSGLTSITIPDSVTSIGEWAFYNCSGLTSITIPDSVTSVGSDAFSGCGNLKKVTVDDLSSWIEIDFGNITANPLNYDATDFYVKDEKYELGAELIIPEETDRIGSYVFYGYTGLTKITIPDSVTSIGDYAFYNCSGLISITIPDSVISIGSYAFSGCSGLTSIIIPDSVTSIRSSAFYDCSGLTSITIPDSVTSIGRGAFSGCSSLTSITVPFVGSGDSSNTHFGYIFGASNYLYNSSYVPSSLNEVIITGETSIGNSAFNGCSGLTSIIIPDSVTSIGNYAFYNCSSLTSINIPDSVTSIGDYAFYNCSSLTSINMPDSVTSIGDYAFYNCSSLTSIAIPDSVTSIGSGAFSGCDGLTSIAIPFIGSGDSSNTHFGYIFGASSYSDNSSYVPSTLKEVVITGGISIESNAFYNCNGLTSITIPDSVTSIGSIAFSGCSGLTSITIGDGVTSIGEYAFYGCSGLTSITIPDSVTSIGSYAFSGCSGLTCITISNSVTSIGSGAFESCSGLTGITIPDSVTNIGQSAFSGCSGLESITIPFVGASIKTASNTYQYPFGYIFGTASYAGGVSTRQYYYGSSTTSTTSSYYYIPSSLKSITVTGGNILYGAFYNCSGLTSITIPDGVTSIGSSAFRDCDGLTNITIPDSVTSIGVSAFNGCSGLTSITIPDSVTSIGNYAFAYCSGLTSITIPDSVTSIGISAFNGCSGLTSVTIGNSVTSIGSSAFSSCSGLTSITIPDSVTSIGSSAFSGCNSLTSITIPFVGSGDSSNTHFGYIFGALNNWNNSSYVPSSLKEVTITGGTSIGEDAFSGCSGLTSITIPNSVTSIGRYAFYNCSGLTSITVPFVHGNFGYIFGASSYSDNSSYVPSSLKEVTITGGTSIGSNAFYNCSGLTSITIPDSVTSIGNNAFYNCRGLTSITIPDSVTSIGSSAFYNCRGLTSITIPDSVTSIGSDAFYNCRGLTRITIPDSVTSIGSSAFYNCSGLTSITVEQGNAVYHSAGNCIIETASGTLIAGCKNSVIPDDGSVTSIGSSAFRGCSGLTGITIPDSVTSIGYDAFRGCSGLTSITIPNSVTSIGSGAFEYCSGLTSITIPDSVTSIGDGAFSYCSGLTSITLPDSVTSIGDSAFVGCSSLTSITIPDSVTSIGSSAFYHCSGLESITIPFIGSGGSSHFGYIFGASSYSNNSSYVPSSLKEVTITGGKNIRSNAFYNCSGLTNITIPNSVTSIGSSAFSGCNRLISITVPFVGSGGSSNTHFGYIFGASGYSDNSSYVPSTLKEVTITGGTSIDDHAFYRCSGLTSITIPDSVTSIGSDAFYRCSGLTSIIIPDSVTSIGDGAFSGCSGLTSITIPDSVTSIGEGAFSGCSDLESITIPFVGSSIKTASDTYQYPFGYIFGTSSYTGGVSTRQYYYGSSTTSITNSYYYIPASLKSVTVTGGNTLNGAFYNCSGLTSITIPDSVTSIGSSAFYNCSGLTSITIPNSVTSIGSSAFYNCTAMTSITIPDSVTSIEDSAFNWCIGLTSITIPDSVTSIGSSAFQGCSGLINITVDQGNLVYHSTDNCIIETASKTLILGCQNSVIPNDGSVTSIGARAFYGCSSLTSITIPDSVTSIGYNAFYKCSGLTSISIPDSVTSIGARAFYGCSSLTSITIPDSVTSIGYDAFYNCSGLTSITIPDSVTSIGVGVFVGCSGLTSITIPDSVTSIGSDAFYNCSGLTSIKFNGTMAQWNAIGKGSNWSYNTGDFTIICTDGTLDKSGNQIS